MITYIVQRDIEGIGLSGHAGHQLATARSTEAVARLAPRVAWCHTWVTADRLFSLYRAGGVHDIREHASLAGFPAGDAARVLSEIPGDNNAWRALMAERCPD